MSVSTTANGVTWPDLTCTIERSLPELYGFDEIEATLLSLSENATYALAPRGEEPKWVARVHRSEYHEQHQIESELAWMRALASDGVVATPQVCLTLAGDWMTRIECADGIDRWVDVTLFLPGETLTQAEFTPSWMARLGAATAAMHDHARTWSAPAGFSRFTWAPDDVLGWRSRWGTWAVLPVGDTDRALLEKAESKVLASLPSFTPENVSLIHSDLRLANLICHDDGLTVIDFDDAGVSWPMLDAGSAASFMQTAPDLTACMESWVTGYRSVAALSEAAVDTIPTFVMLRRLMESGWVASHRQASWIGADGWIDDVARTVEVADHYLRGTLLG